MTKEYLIIGYPAGFSGHGKEFGKVNSDSEVNALKQVDKSIWYSYYAKAFDQKEYDELVKDNNFDIILK